MIDYFDNQNIIILEKISVKMTIQEIAKKIAKILNEK